MYHGTALFIVRARRYAQGNPCGLLFYAQNEESCKQAEREKEMKSNPIKQQPDKTKWDGRKRDT